MAVSGTYTWNPTRAEIINGALRLLKVIDQDGAATANQVTNAAFKLNALVKSLRDEGIHLWSVQEATLTLVSPTIVTGTDGEIYECIRRHTSVAGNRPITGADYTSYWIPSSGTPAVWAAAQSYVSANHYLLAAEIIGIETPFVRDGQYDSLLSPMSREDYLSQGNKYVKGIPTHLVFFRELGGAQLFLYPVPDVYTYVVHFQAIKKSMDVGATGDTLDFTEEWMDALIVGLATRLSGEYDIPLTERETLKREARYLLDIVKGGDSERVSMRISPDMRR